MGNEDAYYELQREFLDSLMEGPCTCACHFDDNNTEPCGVCDCPYLEPEDEEDV